MRIQVIFVVKEVQLFLSTNFSSSGSLVSFSSKSIHDYVDNGEDTVQFHNFFFGGESFHLHDEITFVWIFIDA